MIEKTPAQKAQRETAEAVCVVDLRQGDMVDLEGDEYADPTRSDESYPHDLAIVIKTRLGITGTTEYVDIEFSDGALVRFPASHALMAWGSDPDFVEAS